MDEFANVCRDFLKDLAEDTQLMLAELYAAISPLKTAAAQPHASQITIQLLSDIQKLLIGEKQADYASLDRLMTVLLEQYPVIRVAAGAILSTDSSDMQLPPEEAQAACTDDISQVPLSAPAAAQSPLPADQFLPAPGAQDNNAPAMQSEPEAPAPMPKEAAPDYSGSYEPPFAEGWDFSLVPQCSPAALPIPEEPSATIPAAEPKPDAAQPVTAIVQSPMQKAETPAVPKAASRPRYRRKPKAWYRIAAALFALLLVATAVYIVCKPRVSASMSSLWKSHILNSHPIANAVAFLRGSANRNTVSVASADAPKPVDTTQIRLSSLEGTNGPGKALPAENSGSIVIHLRVNLLRAFPL